MSTQSLANYLNNPTGQYNPYLVAGELQRKEAFAQRQMVEAPQETVVDELVAQALPMGGMPRGGMAMPRPEEVMVSDTITETGISNLPAPNIGQNYADGGIVGYDNGGDVGFTEQLKRGFNERLSGLEEGMDERTKRYQENIRIYQETGKFPEMTDQDLDDAFAYGGIGAIGKVGGKAVPYIKDTAKKAIDYVKNKIKPAPKKKLTKKERDEFLKKQTPQTALEKANQFKKPPPTGFGSGPLSQGLKKGLPAAYEGIKKVGGAGKRYIIRDAPALAGLGGLGYGGYKAWDYLWGEPARQKEAEEKLAKENKDSMEMHRQTRLEREYNEKVQAKLDAQQAARKRQREKEMYLALALGGAKTMAGQSPYALTNIGEGLGAGVAGLATYNQNEMERLAASQAATAKAQQDMRIAFMDYEKDYRDRILKLADNDIYHARLKQIEDNEAGLVDEDLVIKKADLLREFVGLPTASYFANINGQQFTAVE